VPGDQREAQPAGVADGPRDADGVGAGLRPALDLHGDAQLHGQAREQARAQRASVLADRGQRLLEQRDRGPVHDAARHLARGAVPERRLRERLRPAERLEP
jgi:hypothetical protein